MSFVDFYFIVNFSSFSVEFLYFFFFFKQKPAYDMRIIDWSSDVCSSDLGAAGRRCVPHLAAQTAPVAPARHREGTRAARSAGRRTRNRKSLVGAGTGRSPPGVGASQRKITVFTAAIQFSMSELVRPKLELPNGRRKVLLHSCCAPCSGEVMEAMQASGIDYSIFFYNPNIHPVKEYRSEEHTSELQSLMRHSSAVF